MISPINTIKVLSANCRGLQGAKKRFEVLTYFKETKANILCLQDTHWTNKDISSVKQIWEGECIIHGTKTNARGVAILLSKNFEYEIVSVANDEIGNYTCITLKTPTMTLSILTLYGPNTDDPSFFRKVNNEIKINDSDYFIICGDYNLILDPILDCQNYRHVNNPNSRKEILSMIEDLNLIDVFRHFYPKVHRYTWRTRNPVKQARLDFFLISNSMIDLVNSTEIKPGYQSDHSIIVLEIIQSKFAVGKGVWKFNNSLLKNQDYVDLINKVIDSEVKNYALPVYNIEYIGKCPEDIKFTIDDDLFLEILYLKIRGETIKFASILKKCKTSKEEILVKDIEFLENLNNPNSQLLSDKIAELESIRQERMKGHMIRSRVQWLIEGEKPTRYFCNLENKHFLDKTIKKVKKPDGQYIIDQKEILSHVRDYYENLFSSKDHSLQETDWQTTLKDYKIHKIADYELGQLLTEVELGKVLQGMKHNKTPGIDGITSEFLKVFWVKLKFFITRA